jgi:hypothetical protein
LHEAGSSLFISKAREEGVGSKARKEFGIRLRTDLEARVPVRDIGCE